MDELKELRFDSGTLILDHNRVMSPIIPRGYKDMENDIVVKGETVIEGAVYTRKLNIERGPLTVGGALFAKDSIAVATANDSTVRFKKAVGCGGNINMPDAGRKVFGADVNGGILHLKNAVVAANVFAAELTLENCVVLGGAFASKWLSLKDSVVGTFNAPSTSIDGDNCLLYPSAFTVEPLHVAQHARLFSLALADFGNILKGLPEAEMSGKVEIIPSADGQKISLKDKEGNSTLLMTYSIAGKVLAVDLLDLKKLDNHFLLSVGTLGEQLLKQYDFGCDKNGQPLKVDLESFASFLLDIRAGKIAVKSIDGSVSFDELKRFYSE